MYRTFCRRTVLTRTACRLCSFSASASRHRAEALTWPAMMDTLAALSLSLRRLSASDGQSGADPGAENLAFSSINIAVSGLGWARPLQSGYGVLPNLVGTSPLVVYSERFHGVTCSLYRPATGPTEGGARTVSLSRSLRWVPVEEYGRAIALAFAVSVWTSDARRVVR